MRRETTRTLEGKAAIVTGGNVGIGRAAALEFARQGARVTIAARNAETGEETVELIRREGGEALFVRCDVSKAEEVQALVERTVRTFGRLDCAFNNAGILTNKPLADVTEEEFDSLMATNLKGVWLSMKYEIPAMLASGGGAIVNCASVVAQVASPTVSIYSASKAGVLGLTRGAALDYVGQGLRVNAICPGSVETPMIQEFMRGVGPAGQAALIAAHPMGRLGKPQDVAGLVVFLCTESAGFITGQSIAIDGGYLMV
jgi:NAD(P)-dependent dehydrogenase (short-subunit alcohol dehydrogenase family)